MAEPAEEATAGSRYLDTLAAAACGRLPEEVYGYVAQGARDGVTAAEAEQAWDRLRFVPRVLMDVSRVDVAATVLGKPAANPFGIAPTTLQRALHPDGELAVASAARDAGSVMVVSGNAGTPFARIGETGVRWWLQVYVTADRRRTEPVVERAVDAGAEALVLTADTPVVGTKYGAAAAVWGTVDPGQLRVNHDPAEDDDQAVEKARDLGPHDVAWLAERFGLPVVVKGVLHPDDARRCVDAGASAVWVSNHGGRQLDRTIPTAEALPVVADEVVGEIEVYVDGGVRRGAHALAARAMGATAVFLGRPPLWALASGGADGVRRLLNDLAAELEEAQILAGVASFSTVPPDLLRR